MSVLGESGHRVGELTDTDLTVLRRSAFFEGLESPLVERLLPSFGLLTLDRGDVVFHEGDPGDELFVVLSGRVTLSVSSQISHSLLAILDPPDMFGELSLFDPGPRTSEAATLEATRLAVAGRQDVLEWATSAPEVAGRLLQVLARRLRRTNSTVRDLVFVDVPGRLAAVLMQLADRYGQPVADGLVIDHGLTQQQLAELAGASRETVNKALSGFANRGWLSLRSGGGFLLRDAERLAARAGRTPPR